MDAARDRLAREYELDVHLPQMSCRAFAGALALTCSAVLALPSWAVPPTDREYRERSALLYSLSKFVEWPQRPDRQPDDDFLICVLREGAFHAVLSSKLDGKTLRGRTVRIHRLEGWQGADRCAALFVTLASDAINEELGALRGAAVLTVGAADGFLEQGGMIEFVRHRGSLTFEVNLERATAAGLRIDARVLKLARRVYRDGDPS